jgi:hypothetical protein
VKRSPSAVQNAARIVAEICAEHPDEIVQFLDDGLEVRPTGKGLSVLCRSCRTLLIVTERKTDEDAARNLALVNMARRPCCERWEARG